MIDRRLIFLVSIVVLVIACLPGPPASPTFIPTSTELRSTATITQPAPTKVSTSTASPPPLTPTNPPTPTSTINKQPVNIQLQLAQIKMFNDQTGWSIDINGHILYTKNSGKSWKDISPRQAPKPVKDAPPPMIPTACFLSPSHAWLVYPRYDQPLLLLRSTDSGVNWIELGALPNTDDLERLAPISLWFLDDKQGWFWAQAYTGMHHVYPFLFKTTDGGGSWKLIYSPVQGGTIPETTLHGSYSLPFGDQIYGFFDPQHGVAGTGILQTTRDSGASWKTISPPALTGQPPLKNPYVYVSAPILKNEVAVIQVLTYDFEHVYNPPGDMFEDIPKAAHLAWTEDSGKNWTARKAPALIGTLSMFDANHTWFLGKSDADPKAPVQLYFSADQGQSWKQVAGYTQIPLGSEIDWVDSQTGYAIPPTGSRNDHFAQYDRRFLQSGSLYKTVNGGQTWQEIVPGLE